MPEKDITRIGEVMCNPLMQSLFVPKAEIEANGYDLSINKYKEVEYVPVEYEPTEVILDRIDEIEREIQTELSALRSLLKNN